MKKLQQARRLTALREEKGKELREEKISVVRDTLNKFKGALEDFAGKHKSRINSDPEFRDQFHRLCKAANVDPLASSKGFWTDILGLGDFYFELGVVIVEKCLQTRAANGGMILLPELLHLIRTDPRSRGRQQTSEEDVLTAVDKLRVLGNGFRLLSVGRQRFVVSVPTEISQDSQELMAAAQRSPEGCVTEGGMRAAGWTGERFVYVLGPLLREGLVWVDRDKHGAAAFYFPSISLA